MANRQEIWTETQQRVIDLARSCSAETLGMHVPACPDWTVKDLVAHMTGVDVDFLAGDVDADLSDEWTANHVRSRKDDDLENIIQEWEKVRERTAELFGGVTEEMETGLVADASVHEQDLRGAIGKPGARDQAGNRLSLEMFADGLASRIADAGLPSLRVEAGAWQRTFAGDGPEVVVDVAEFEFFRALTGRRSVEQVQEWTWSDPSEAKGFIDCLSAFGTLRDTALVE